MDSLVCIIDDMIFKGSKIVENIKSDVSLRYTEYIKQISNNSEFSHTYTIIWCHTSIEAYGLHSTRLIKEYHVFGLLCNIGGTLFVVATVSI